MNDTINALLEQVPTQSESSKALERLDPETRGILSAFEQWLVREDGKSSATARAYKSYVATAICAMQEGVSWKDLTTDVRSAVNAFTRYAKTLAPVEDEGGEQA